MVVIVYNATTTTTTTTTNVFVSNGIIFGFIVTNILFILFVLTN